MTQEPGASAGSGRKLARAVRRRLFVAVALASAAGAVIVFVVLETLLPGTAAAHEETTNTVLPLFFALALPAAAVMLSRSARWLWLEEDRDPDPADVIRTLREPVRLAAVPALIWGVAVVVFAGLDLDESAHRALDIAMAIGLGGLTTVGLCYLLAERLMRPVTARALATGPPEEPVGLGVGRRLVIAWALASGVPLAALATLGGSALAGEYERVDPLATTLLIVALSALAAGFAASSIAARSLADSLHGVRDALAKIRAGDLDARVAVDDGSEVGLLQAGFNEMAGGLRAREQMRDLFGRYVGADVARAALARDEGLGGEVREVAALFIDLSGSTRIAATRAPEEVVELLNRFFAIVVETVEAEQGLVNKFEGDAALCVFGAPVSLPDAADRALAAARGLRGRLAAELPEADAGIGVSAGAAVAGRVGAESRFEYTVIGDPINEAARLCELAKRRPERTLASEAILDRASAPERQRWALGEEVLLRGRTSPTRLAAPLDADAPAGMARDAG